MKKPLNGLLLMATAGVFFALGVFFVRSLAPSMHNSPVSDCAEAEPFMEFLSHFDDDMRFQKERTLFPLLYVTTSESDPARCDTFLIEKHQWTPLSVLDSAHYAVQVTPVSDDGTNQLATCRMKVMVIGTRHGEKLVFSFVVEEDKWWLSAFEDYSL